MKEAQTLARVVFIAEGKNKKVKYLYSLALLNAIYINKRCIYIEWGVYLYKMVSFDTIFLQYRCSKIWHFHTVFVNQLRLCWEINDAHRPPHTKDFSNRIGDISSKTCTHGAQLVGQILTYSAPHQCTLGAVRRGNSRVYFHFHEE